MKRYIIKYGDDTYLLAAEFYASLTSQLVTVVTDCRDDAMAFKEKYLASALAKLTGGKVEIR